MFYDSSNICFYDNNAGFRFSYIDCLYDALSGAISNKNDFFDVGDKIKNEMMRQAGELIETLANETTKLELVASEMCIGDFSKSTIALLIKPTKLLMWKCLYSGSQERHEFSESPEGAQICVYLSIGNRAPKRETNAQYNINITSIFPVKDKYDLWKNENAQYIDY